MASEASCWQGERSEQQSRMLHGCVQAKLFEKAFEKAEIDGQISHLPISHILTKVNFSGGDGFFDSTPPRLPGKPGKYSET